MKIVREPLANRKREVRRHGEEKAEEIKDRDKNVMEEIMKVRRTFRSLLLAE
tara:strand:+ start:517 stop:672 length:156 start_codon:yes stop_codon:yes gene_type:complete